MVEIFLIDLLKNIRTYENVRKVPNVQRDDYRTGCLLDYMHFKEILILISKDVSKQQTPDANPKAIQQINITGNQDWAGTMIMLLIIEEVNETILDFSQEILRVL